MLIVGASHAVQVAAVDAESCAAELHHALSRSDYHQASKLVQLAPHSGVFEMVNKQQQTALHLAGKDPISCIALQRLFVLPFIVVRPFSLLRRSPFPITPSPFLLHWQWFAWGALTTAAACEMLR